VDALLIADPLTDTTRTDKSACRKFRQIDNEKRLLVMLLPDHRIYGTEMLLFNRVRHTAPCIYSHFQTERFARNSLSSVFRHPESGLPPCLAEKSSPKTQVPGRLRYSSDFMGARNGRIKRPIRDRSENNSLSYRLNGGESGILLSTFLYSRINIDKNAIQPLFMQSSECWSREPLGV
jgi:hypothetical protein